MTSVPSHRRPDPIPSAPHRPGRPGRSTPTRRAPGAVARVLAMAVVSSALFPAGVPAQGGPQSRGATVRTGYVMGTRFRIELPAGLESHRALAASEAAMQAVEGMDALLSTWRDDTPLSRLNRIPPGVPHPVDTALLPLLDLALAWSARTEGTFDPRVGALVDAWSLRDGGGAPTPRELDRARDAVGDAGLTLRQGMLTRHHAAAWLDAGGFGKGAALAAAARALGSLGVDDALVDLGGQLLVLGGPDGAQGWPVSVAHPRERGTPAASLRVRNASVATSGNSERGLHLLDPRAGRPAPEWGSVTVVSADALEADILSTALYVLGPEAGMALALTLPDTGVLFLIPSKEGVDARWNPAMERWLVAPFPTGTVALSRPTPKGHDP